MFHIRKQTLPMIKPASYVSLNALNSYQNNFNAVATDSPEGSAEPDGRAETATMGESLKIVFDKVAFIFFVTYH